MTAAGVTQEPGTIAISSPPTTGPTGQVDKDTSSFLVNGTGTPASYIFANRNGTISTWNSSAGTTAVKEVTTSGAVYTGLVLQSTTTSNFSLRRQPRSGANRRPTARGPPLGLNAFKAPELPTSSIPLVPFDVEDVNGYLDVVYAWAGTPVDKTVAPQGVEAVPVFDTNGHFITQKIIARGKLASPWGIPHGQRA